jgi:inosine triphosphate pyrophosphatase
MSKPVTFVTGNKNKLRESEGILGIKLLSQTLDLPELQFERSDQVAIYKAQEAARIIGGPVLIDDTALHFHAIGGLPGAYIRAFVDKLSPANLARLLYGFDDKSATVTCSIGYCAGPGSDAVVFTGAVDGTVVEPKGTGGFGFDPIFKPNGYEQTYAELNEDEKNRMSHRALAWAKLKESGVVQP